MSDQDHRAHPRSTPSANEGGFTLIELLIVILILGILAAIVIFSLSGVTSASAQSACNTDARSVETAVGAYQAQNGGNSPTAMTSAQWQSALTGTAKGGPYLHSFPSSNHYSITVTNVAGGQGNVYYSGGTTTTATLYDTTSNCAGVS